MAIQQGGAERPLSTLTWRPMTPDDLDGVVAVAQLSFPDHPEERACFANRLELHPDTRGGGHTRPVVERLAEQAKAAGWPAVALVAVNDASSFWARNGFEVQNPPGMAEKLASYGDDARYMVRPL